MFLCYIICFAANEVKKNILTKSFPRSFLIRANKATKEFAYLDEWSLSLHVSLLPYALREFVPHVQIKKVTNPSLDLETRSKVIIRCHFAVQRVATSYYPPTHAVFSVTPMAPFRHEVAP